jgi:hypothetical protein
LRATRGEGYQGQSPWLVGIGVTAYVAWLTSRVEDAKSQVQATRTFIENTKSEADTTQATISTQQAKATELKNTFDGLTQDAIASLKKAAPGAVEGAVAVFLSPVAADVQQLKQNLAKASTLSNVIGSRVFGQTYPNTTGKTLIVIVTAYNNAKGNTMCGNVAASPNQLPTGASGGNPTTTVQSSFIDNKFSASITFVVSAGQFYSVTTDGGSETVVAWMEVTL